MLPEAKTLELIGRFYDAALQPTLLSQAVRSLTDVLGAAAGGILIRTFSPTDRAEQTWVGLDPAFEEAYLQHYFVDDPWMAASVGKVEPGTCALGQDLLTERKLLRTEFYNDLCRPFGFHDFAGGVVLHKPGQYWVSVGMLGHLGGAPFHQDHLATLRLLMPHLQRSLEVSRRLREAQQETEIVGDVLHRLPFGVLLLDAARRVVRANRAAEGMLARKDGLSVDATGLVALESHARTELRAVLAEALHGGFGNVARPNFVRIPRSSSPRPLALIVAPVAAETSPLSGPRVRCVVYAIDPEVTVDPPQDVLASLFKLTPAEARLVLLVGQGRVPKEAATELGISWNTARSQLCQVFAKTGTDRQATLVRLLASLGVLGEPPSVSPDPSRQAGS